MKRLIFLTIALMIFSCKKTEPKLPMSTEEFQQIYTQALLIHTQTDSTHRAARIDSLLKANNTDLDELKRMVAHLNETPEAWADFYDEVQKDLHQKSIEEETKQRQN